MSAGKKSSVRSWLIQKQGTCRNAQSKRLSAHRASKEETGMAGVLDAVNQRTQLAGQNRLELLLFRLEGSQLYGINVFKVKEVLQCPRLTVMPKARPVVRGVASIRGSTLSIIDLSLATGKPALKDLQNSFAIIVE